MSGSNVSQETNSVAEGPHKNIDSSLEDLSEKHLLSTEPLPRRQMIVPLIDNEKVFTYSVSIDHDLEEKDTDEFADLTNDAELTTHDEEIGNASSYEVTTHETKPELPEQTTTAEIEDRNINGSDNVTNDQSFIGSDLTNEVLSPNQQGEVTTTASIFSKFSSLEKSYRFSLATAVVGTVIIGVIVYIRMN